MRVDERGSGKGKRRLIGRHRLVRNVEVLSRTVICLVFSSYYITFKEKKWGERQKLIFIYSMDCWNDRSSSVSPCELDVFSLIVSVVCCYITISHAITKFSRNYSNTTWEFPLQNRKKIELGNDIGICKLKFKKIKSKNSIKTFYPWPQIFSDSQTADGKSPNHTTISVSSILTFDDLHCFRRSITSLCSMPWSLFWKWGVVH